MLLSAQLAWADKETRIGRVHKSPRLLPLCFFVTAAAAPKRQISTGALLRRVKPRPVRAVAGPLAAATQWLLVTLVQSPQGEEPQPAHRTIKLPNPRFCCFCLSTPTK